MRELIERTNLKNKEAIIKAMEGAGLTERDIPNLPRISGVRIAGVSTYIIQSELNAVLSGESHMDVSEPEVVPMDEMEAMFGSRIYAALRKAGYDTVESVAALSREELLDIDGISDKSASTITEAIG